MPQLDSLAISKDGKSVTVGGGINSKKLIDMLWAAGKQTGRIHPSKMLKVIIPKSNQSPDAVNALAFWGLRWVGGMAGCRVITGLLPTNLSL